jgi:DNA-binding CsgD family transcriptional regulator
MTGGESASIEDLVLLLIERSSGTSGSGGLAQQDPNGEDVLFDIDVQGARYLLVRLPKPIQLEVQLSPRETEIVRLVARGHSNKIIADVLSISSWTVCTHLRRIFAKLGVTSRAAMVARMPEIGRASASRAPARDATHDSRSSGIASSLQYPATSRGR